MGGVVQRDCPYCRTRAVAFTAISEWTAGDNSRRALFLCGACKEGVIWEWWGNPQSIVNVIGFLDRWGIYLSRQWPEPLPGAAPDDTPPNVGKFFAQGVSSLETGSFDAAGMMFRKALESATKILDPDSANARLVRRIDLLAEAQKITPDLAQWAHEIRLGGNDAAHEEELFTQEEAEELRHFIESFLRYAFTLPSAVRRRATPSEASAE